MAILRCMDADSAEWNSAFISEFYTEHAYKKKFNKDAPRLTGRPTPTTKTACGFGQEGVRVAEWWRREDVASKLLKLSDGTVIFEGKVSRTSSPFWSLSESSLSRIVRQSPSA